MNTAFHEIEQLFAPIANAVSEFAAKYALDLETASCIMLFPIDDLSRSRTMRLEYYPDTDTLYIQLREVPGSDAQEVAEDIVLDFNEAGEVVGIEIEHASQRMDLGDFHLSTIPASNIAPSAR